MSSDDVKQALNTRAEDFARWLFPAGLLHGSELQVGSLNGEQGKSLCIRIDGVKVGIFKDFATGDAGDNLLELYAQAKAVPFKDALRACADWLGVGVNSIAHGRPNWSVLSRHAKVEPERIGVMPDAVASAWNEGVDYILAHPEKAKQLATFRGWPVEFAQYVIGCAVISLPLRYNERGIAFQVVVPEGERGAMTTRPLGYHIRLKGKPWEKASWRFLPNEKEHGQSIPALPWFLGEFEQARLLVITEGQWDAITFALAAGWLGDACLWPEGVGLIGIRGASGCSAFLRHYRRYWPAGANCLLLADADIAGESWSKGDDCFAARLANLCAKVAVVDCYPHKDFNDLYRAEEPGKNEISDLLTSRGMADEIEVLA